jgi:hypothetical protein
MPITPATPSEPEEPRAALPSFGRAMAAIGHVSRGGRWQLPQRFRAVAWMGGVDLDLTDASIPTGGAELELLAVFGVITVRIPDDLGVFLVGDALSWTADPGVMPRATLHADAALTIAGRAVLGRILLRFVRAPSRTAG